jgi:TrmH family RNA methyltransferase
MGACFTQGFVRTTLPQLRQWSRTYRVQLIGASPNGAVPYTDMSYRTPLVLLLGEERTGLTTDERAICDELVRIPMVAGADSLNLGVAGSLLYEVLRATEHVDDPRDG